MAGQGKEKKRDDASRKEELRKEDPSRDTPKKDEVTAILRQLTEQVALIRADVDDIRAAKPIPDSNPTKKAKVTSKSEGALVINDTEVARLGYAFSSPQKVALIRLLHTGGEQSAAQLGEQAGLTTGSLYHHLRELIHADVLTQETRNRYALSDRGRQAVLALAELTH